MQQTAFSSSAVQIGSTTITTRIAAVGKDWWRRVCKEYRRRATARALQGLEDRTLKDIGLTRSEIDSIARYPDRQRWPDRVYFDLRTS